MPHTVYIGGVVSPKLLKTKYCLYEYKNEKETSHASRGCPNGWQGSYQEIWQRSYDKLGQQAVGQQEEVRVTHAVQLTMAKTIIGNEIGITYDVLLAKYKGKLFHATTAELARVTRKGIGEVFAAMRRFQTK